MPLIEKTPAKGVKHLGKTALFAAAITIGLSGAVDAAVLDLVAGTNNGTTLTMPEATITAGAGTTLGVGDFIANAACPGGTSGCNGSMTLTFNFDVNNVAFEYGFGNPGDTATITGFDSGGNIVETLLLSLTSGVSSASFAALSTLRSILFSNTAATGAGYAYGNISFSAVPIPAALPLLASGLGALGFIGWRRKRKATATAG